MDVEFLAEQARLHGETLSWARLLQGFDFQGRRVPLVSQPGIFKPAILPEVPLTIRTAPEEEGRVRPYADEMDSEGRLRYRYRGTDPRHPDNVGLRRAMLRRLPLIYLFGVVPGQYMPVWPVYVVGDEPAMLSFLVSVDEQKHTLGTLVEKVSPARRRPLLNERVTFQPNGILGALCGYLGEPSNGTEYCPKRALRGIADRSPSVGNI